MKILITHFYTRDNRGDAAILSALLLELNRVFGEQHISIVTMEDIDKRKTFEGYSTIKSLISQATLHKGRITRWFVMAYFIIIPLMWCMVYRLLKIKMNFLLTKDLYKLLNSISQSDLIILVGGGYLRGAGGLGDDINYLFIIYPILLEKLLNKTIVLHAQSIGPFGDRFQKFISGWVLKKVDLIITREEISTKLLENMQIPLAKIKRSVDAGFLFKTNIKTDLKKYGINSSRKKSVGITVARKWLNNKNLQHAYESEIAKFADYVISKKKLNVIFIPQVTSQLFDDDDRSVAKRIIVKMKEKSFVWGIEQEMSHYEIKSFYANMNYIVGTRFHSVIFSLTSYVPAVAIEYEHKTRGIMKDLDLTDWVIKLEDLTAERLIKKFDKLVLKQEEYIASLKAQIPSYIKDARGAVDTIKQVVLLKDN